MTATEINASMDRALDLLHARAELQDGRRFTRPRSYGWALYVVVNGTHRKVGEARTEGQYRSFLRGGQW